MDTVNETRVHTAGIAYEHMPWHKQTNNFFSPQRDPLFYIF